jgi:hypothetical protein
MGLCAGETEGYMLGQRVHAGAGTSKGTCCSASWPLS